MTTFTALLRRPWVGVSLLSVGLLLGLGSASLLFAQSTRLPPEKQAFLDREERQLQEARTRALTQTPVPVSVVMTQVALTPVPTSPPSSIPRRPAGAGTIVENAGGPFSSQETRIFNHWYYVNAAGQSVVVWAGGDGQNRLQGKVVVLIFDDRNRLVPGTGGTYLTPRATGPVHVIAATGTVLTLQSESGDSYVFDVESRTFQGGLAPPDNR